MTYSVAHQVLAKWMEKGNTSAKLSQLMIKGWQHKDLNNTTPAEKGWGLNAGNWAHPQTSLEEASYLLGEGHLAALDNPLLLWYARPVELVRLLHSGRGEHRTVRGRRYRI